jgi:hypothetical protein
MLSPLSHGFDYCRVFVDEICRARFLQGSILLLLLLLLHVVVLVLVVTVVVIE